LAEQDRQQAHSAKPLTWNLIFTKHRYIQPSIICYTEHVNTAAIFTFSAVSCGYNGICVARHPEAQHNPKFALTSKEHSNNGGETGQRLKIRNTIIYSTIHSHLDLCSVVGHGMSLSVDHLP
jgi:hypothetical protein